MSGMGMDGMVSAGRATIIANSDYCEIKTGITDATYTPTLVATPENINTRTHLQTSIVFDAGQWVFKVYRSIGNDNEEMKLHWKVIALETVKEIGATVIPATEA